ncbi:glycosyltransferase [Neorhizobium sp. IRS_2294]
MSLHQAALTEMTARADRLRDNRQWLAAATLYGEALEHGTPSAEGWVQYAHMLKEAELFEAAIRAYEFAIHCDGTYPDARLHLAHLFKRLGQLANALATFEALSALPLSPPVEQEIAGLRVSLMQAGPNAPTNLGTRNEGMETATCLAGFSRLQGREEIRIAEINERNGQRDGEATPFGLSMVEILRLAKERSLQARLNPKAHLVIRENKFVATTKEPQFSVIVEGEQLRPGWFSIELEVSGTAMVFTPVLYVEHRAEWSRFSTFNLRPQGNGKFRAVGLLEDAVLRLRLDPASTEGSFVVNAFSLRQIGMASSFRHARRIDRDAARAALTDLRTHRSSNRFAHDLAKILSYPGRDAYETWIAKHDTVSDEDLARFRRAVDRWRTRPMISAVVSISSETAERGEETLRSLKRQIYENWQLHVVLARDVPQNRKDAITSLQENDTRFITTFAEEDKTAQSLLNACDGRFVIFLSAGDILAPSALYKLVEHHIAKPMSKLIYSDEDAIENQRRHSPLFKPDWDPDYFYATNYVGRAVAFETGLAQSCCPSFGNLANLDTQELVLRAAEVLSPDEITHIPRVLYHRGSPAKTSGSPLLPYPMTEARRQAVEDSLRRQGRRANTSTLPGNLCRVIWPVPDPAPLVTLIIPTRDYADLLRACIDSILDHTDYPAFEIVIVDNGSVEQETLAYFDTLRSRHNIRILAAPGPFNFSRLNNSAVENAQGSMLALINNDIIVTDGGWLREMVSQASRPEIGAVGAKLLYDTGHIQHAGIICGIGLVAAHPHKFRGGDDPGYMGRIAATQSLSAVTAACLMVEKAKYCQVGGMDENNLKVAFNDVDLCLKLDAAGYRNLYTPHATLIHLESISRGLDTSSEKAERYRAEAAFMLAKWGDKVRRDRFYNVNLTAEREDFSYRD